MAPTTNGLKPDQLAQLGQLTPIRPPMQEPQMVTMNVNQQQQQIPVMGQQGVVRGQLVQVPAPQQQQVIQQQQTPLLHLPRHPLPVLRPGQPAQQQQPTTVVVTQQQHQQIQQQQPQQLQIQQKGQMGGSIIITTTPSSVQQQQYQQQQQQHHQPQQLQIQQVVQQPQQQMQIQQLQPQQLQQQQQIQTVYQPQQIRPAIVQGMVRPAVPQQQQQQQPPPQHPAGSQQVQLRVSNDDANRQFCLSWLKATYELSAGSSIEQQVMYKQYLASLHKLGKREVISAQHYAVCVR